MSRKFILTDEQKAEIIRSKLSVKQLAELYKVSKYCIYDVLNNRITI